MTFRDYQLPAIQALAHACMGILKAPAGSGKTVMAAAALAQWAVPRSRIHGRKMTVAWIAHSMEQCDQAKKAIAAFPVLDTTIELTVACYASGMSLAMFDLAILDECHHVAAPVFRKMLECHQGSRWGLSATPDRADDLAKDVYEILGPTIHEVKREALVEAGQLAHAKVIFHQPNTPKELEDHINHLAEQEFHKRMKRFGHMRGVNAQEQKSRCVWQFAQEHGVFLNEKRNASLIQLANLHAQEKDSAILLIGKIEHGEALATQIPGAQMVYSKMGAKKRREAIAEFAAGNIRTIIATSLADEGLDVPRANVLICGSAGRSQAKAEQRTGRVLRKFEGKEHGIIHDFMDVQHYFLKAQSNRRAQTYKSLGYHIQFPE